MAIFAILLFFIYTWGFGFSLLKLFMVKESEDWLEKNVMRIGLGLAFIPLIGVIINLVGIPLYWWLFLALSIIYPVYSLIASKFNVELPKPSLKLKRSTVYSAIVLVLFAFTLFMYLSGAFKYPYLEDDDPWTHAVITKYVAMEKTVYEPIPGRSVFQYIDPYPPGYNVLMGMLHQTTQSINWTLKFFNALIISLSILFFYFFSRQFMKSRQKALFATFILAMIPCFFSHFIWAHALAVTLFIPALYFMERIMEDKRIIPIAGIAVAGILLTQPTQSIKFVGVFIIFWIGRSIADKRLFLKILTAGIIAVLLSMTWYAPMIIKYTPSGFAGEFGIGESGDVTKRRGTADRLYTFSDFFIAKKQNMINNPIGVGVFISILVILSFVYLAFANRKLFREKNIWMIIGFLWLLFTFIGIHGARLPFQLFAFRFWMLFAMPASIMAAVGMWFLFSLGKRIGMSRVILLLAVVAGIILTSGYQKYTLNTATWPPGGFWTGFEEVDGYVWMKESIPDDSKIFHFSNDAPIIGMDKFACAWCADAIDFKKSGLNTSSDEAHEWFRVREYDYMIIDGQTVREFGQNLTDDFLTNMSQLNFKLEHQNLGFLLFRVV